MRVAMGDSLEQRFAGLVQPHFAALYRAALRLTRRRPDCDGAFR
jgi:DNA-directed RNA polymerase specialized sigma24 family protein